MFWTPQTTAYAGTPGCEQRRLGRRCRRRTYDVFFNIRTLMLSSCQWSTYSYQDKAQEAKRLVEAEKQEVVSSTEIAKRKQDRADKKAANSAWSNKTSRKEEREKRKEKKDRKRKWLKTQQSTPSAAAEAHDASDAEGEDDWDELAREERMAKKVKRGDVSQSQFDVEFADL